MTPFYREMARPFLFLEKEKKGERIGQEPLVLQRQGGKKRRFLLASEGILNVHEARFLQGVQARVSGRGCVRASRCPGQSVYFMR